MSSINDIFTALVDIKRLTSSLLDGITPSTIMSFDRQPERSTRLQIKIEGAVVSGGLVNVSGSTDETFNFTGNSTLKGSKDFTSVSGLTLSGIVGGSIYIDAINKYGQPNNQEKNVYSNMPVRFYAQDGRIRMQNTGQEKIAKYKIMADKDRDLKENDILIAVSGITGLTRGILSFVHKIVDFSGNGHHVQAEIQDL